MRLPGESPLDLRRRLNELAQQLRVMAAQIDKTANELFDITEIQAATIEDLGRELEEAVRDAYVVTPRRPAFCTDCDCEGLCVK
jgi:hypothetical protein